MSGTEPSLRVQRETWMERFPSSDLARRLDDLKQARKDGWDLTILISPDSREIIVAGWYVGFASVRCGAVFGSAA